MTQLIYLQVTVTGLCLTWSKTPNTGFFMTGLQTGEKSDLSIKVLTSSAQS